MIQKQYKLTTKEVNYLLRRRQAIYAGGYKILHCDQYPNHAYHQTGVQVSGKIHKHAVQRNIIRRAYYAAREDLIDKAVHNHYHKVFVMIHPEHCEEIHRMIQDKDKTSETSTHQQIKQHFSTIITTALGKLNHSTSKPSGNRSRSHGRSL